MRAQITQGRYTAGDHPRVDVLEILVNRNTRALSFSPSAGYFLTNNFLLGGQFSAFNVDENNVIDYSRWRLAPFARYYLPGNLFITAGLGVGNERRSVGQLGVVQDQNTFYDLSAGIGKDFFLRGDVALEGIARYQYSSLSGEFLPGKVVYHNIVLDFNLQPFLGAGLDPEVAEPLAAGSILLDLQGRMQWQMQEGTDGFFNLTLAPRAGYFLTNEIVIGGAFSLNVLSAESETVTGFGLAPFGRYYLPPLADNLYAFGELSIGFQKDPGDEDLIWNGRFGPGLDLFLSPHVAVEGLLAYSYLKRGAAPALERALIQLGVQFFL